MLMEDHVFIYPPAFVDAVRKAKRVARRVVGRKVGEVIRFLRDLRLDVKKIEEPSRDYRCVGVDSTWTKPYLELLCGDCALIVCGCMGDGVKEMIADVLVNDGEDTDRAIWRKSVELERRLASEILENHEFDILVFDGNIVPYPVMLEGMWEGLGDVMRDLIGRAKRRGVSIVGVVKRVRSRYLSAIAGRPSPVNDKVIASLILKRGEFFSMGRYGEIIPRYFEVTGRRGYIDSFERVKEQIPVDEVEVVFYKGWRQSSYDLATKIEVLDLAGLGVEEIVGYMSKISTETGFPAVVDWIDRLVRNEFDILRFIRDLIEKEAVDILPDEEREIAIKLLGFTNPQKS